MANVQIIQRHAHLASAVRLEFVNGREGRIAKAVLTAISNVRRGSGESREEESTAIQWTLWGKQAENAAEYLAKGAHVNIVGRVRNNNYRDKDGNEVFALAFTAEEVDYLDSRADSEARRARADGVKDQDEDGRRDGGAPSRAATASSTGRKSRSEGSSARAGT